MATARDFEFGNISMNGFDLTIRCQEYAITRQDEDEMSDEDFQMWERIVEILNDKSGIILD